MLSKRLRNSRGFDLAHLLIGIELCLVFFFSARPAGDPDYGWHVTNGRHVFDGTIFNGHDLYSWTASGAWVAHEWLLEAVMNVVHGLFGPTGNSVFFAVAGCCAYAALAWRLRGSFPWKVVLVALPICFVGAMRSLGARPQVVELLYVALLVAAIDVYLARPVPRFRMLLVAGLAGVVWANTHGSFLLLPAVLAITAFELALSGDRRWKDVALASMIAIAASLANPWGVRLLGFATQSVSSGVTLAHIQEWQRPVLTELLAIPIFLQLALAAAGVFERLNRHGKDTRADREPPRFVGILRAVAFAFLALSSGRHVMLFGIACGSLIAAGISFLMTRRSRSRASDAPAMPADQNLRSMINIAAMSVVTVTVLIASWQQISPAAQRAVVERTYPEGIAAHLSRDMNASVRLFNAYDWGGFLIQRDILPVFIDGRSELYGDTQLSRYASIIHLQPGWSSVIDDLGVNTVLMPRRAPIVNALQREGWSLVEEDSVGALLVRNKK